MINFTNRSQVYIFNFLACGVLACGHEYPDRGEQAPRIWARTHTNGSTKTSLWNSPHVTLMPNTVQCTITIFHSLQGRQCYINPIDCLNSETQHKLADINPGCSSWLRQTGFIYAFLLYSDQAHKSRSETLFCIQFVPINPLRMTFSNNDANTLFISSQLIGLLLIMIIMLIVNTCTHV